MIISNIPCLHTARQAQVQIKVKHPRWLLASPTRAVLSSIHARLVNLVTWRNQQNEG